MMVYKRNMLKSLITITLIHLEFALQQTRKYRIGLQLKQGYWYFIYVCTRSIYSSIYMYGSNFPKGFFFSINIMTITIGLLSILETTALLNSQFNILGASLNCINISIKLPAQSKHIKFSFFKIRLKPTGQTTVLTSIQSLDYQSMKKSNFLNIKMSVSQ